jgi:diamine N-acetyltransferase
MKTLENSVVKLRNIEPEDIDLLFETENNTEFWEYSDTVIPFSKHFLNIYIKNASKDIFSTKQLKLIIESTTENKVVGFIDLFEYEPIHLRAAVGIIILKDERQKQYAFNALKIIQHYAFNILKLNQLYCNISEDNLYSIKLFEKAGFSNSGIKKNWINTETGLKNVLFFQCFNR